MDPYGAFCLTIMGEELARRDEHYSRFWIFENNSDRGEKMVGKVFAGLVLGLVATAATADAFKCDGSLTRVRTEGSSVKQIGPKPYNGAYKLEISDWNKSSIKIVETVNGKSYPDNIPVVVTNGVYVTDHTMKKGSTVSTTKINFNVHTKDASIIYVMTKGAVSIESTFTGSCR